VFFVCLDSFRTQTYRKLEMLSWQLIQIIQILFYFISVIFQVMTHFMGLV